MILKIGKRVQTPHGVGTILGIERTRTTKRYGVILDDPKKLPKIPVPHYYPGELKETDE